jgi:hypothetical protein
MTTADWEAFAKLPKGKWFTVACVLPLLGSKPRYRINRLVAQGVVTRDASAGNPPEYIIPERRRSASGGPGEKP